MTSTPLHAAPHAPDPAQAARGVDALLCGAPLTAVQAPTAPATLHAWHCPEQLVLQQTPSTQLPDAHSVPAAQAVPFTLRHWPTAPVTLQAYPAVLHALLQHTPDTQNPLVHALFPVHVLPFATLGTH